MDREGVYPNLYVVGVPRSGTSYLYEVFKGSQSIFAPNRKEFHFLSKDFVSENSYHAIPEVADENSYKSFFCEHQAKFQVDVSPSYLYSKEALKRIIDVSASNPGPVKVIICLRDPLERAVSHYLMDRAKGYTTKALSNILSSKSSIEYKQVIELSQYQKYVPAYEQAFGDNCLIVPFSRIKDGTALVKIAEFLDVEPLIDSHRKNESKAPRLGIGAIYRSCHGKRIAALLPGPAKDFLRKALFSTPPNIQIDKASQKLLKAELNDANTYFSTLLTK